MRETGLAERPRKSGSEDTNKSEFDQWLASVLHLFPIQLEVGERQPF